MDFKHVQSKWQEAWKKEKLFHVERDGREKYYIAIVYPYMNGLLHLGHLFTYMQSEVRARFKRMQGKNVLIKFGFHCTGTPIVAAAQRVKDGEEKQIEILKSMDIPSEEIKNFADPEYWATYFPQQTLQDLYNIGISIDERYTFKTTSLNPAYDAFIRWQFNKLKEKDYVKKGKHPVVWDPKANTPCGDHDRLEGEGETPKDFTWVKFRMKDSELVLMSGTTRPDALYGQTNLWVNPLGKYVEVNVEGERWIVGKEAVQKIEDQYAKPKVVREVKPEELIGKKVKGPLVDYDIYVLPADFIDASVGSGIVYSALETPQDYMEVLRLHDDKERCERFGLPHEEAKKVVPKPNISVTGMEEDLGKAICKEFNAKSYKDEEQLEAAKQEINKRVFRKGVMMKHCGEFAGIPVKIVQSKIVKKLVNEREAVPFYELTGKVVSRSLAECIVKVVQDQWFIEYNDELWKQQAHECLDSMQIIPEKLRKQFSYVIDWLNHWACAREFGLGTKLPWDEQWVIESLSDSTIQMAYATISKYLEHPGKYDFSIKGLNDSFFDYVMLGKGDKDAVEKSTGIPASITEEMRQDFCYFYPFDFRNSAKDLLQNHLTFCMFNHAAIFPKEYWPKTFSVNGRVLVNNEKMSKSKGNFFTVRQLYEEHGADPVRLTAANAGDGSDDANYDSAFLEVSKKKLTELFALYAAWYGKGRTSKMHVDSWFNSVVNECVQRTTESLEDVQNKAAVQAAFLDLTRYIQWYLRRTNNQPEKELLKEAIEKQILLLTPFVPHFCEEAWTSIGKKGFVSNESWPKTGKIDKEALQAEEQVALVLDDIKNVKELVGKGNNVTLFVAEPWKYDLFTKVKTLLQENKEVIKEVMADAELKKHGKDIMKFLPKLVKHRNVPEVDKTKELALLREAASFFTEETGMKVVVEEAENSKEAKAKQALPSKPAILLA